MPPVALLLVVVPPVAAVVPPVAIVEPPVVGLPLDVLEPTVVVSPVAVVVPRDAIIGGAMELTLESWQMFFSVGMDEVQFVVLVMMMVGKFCTKESFFGYSFRRMWLGTSATEQLFRRMNILVPTCKSAMT